MGAMPAEETENCREILDNLGSAIAALKALEERRTVVKDSLNATEIPL